MTMVFSGLTTVKQKLIDNEHLIIVIFTSIFAYSCQQMYQQTEKTKHPIGIIKDTDIGNFGFVSFWF